MLSLVKEVELAKQFFFYNVSHNQVQTSCGHTQCHILIVAYHCVCAKRASFGLQVDHLRNMLEIWITQRWFGNNQIVIIM
jgi:hypothetical protein